MGLPSKKDKKVPEQDAELVELFPDREQKLSKAFEDANLESLISGKAAAEGDDFAPAGVELGDADESTPVLPLSLAPSDEAANIGEVDTQHAALWAMAEKLFELVVCERNFDDLMEVALNAVMGAVGAQAGSVLEYDHAHQDFFFRASSGGASPSEKLKAFRVPATKGIVGHVAESREPLLVRDLAEDKRQMRAIGMSVGFEAKTCMAAPVLIEGQIYGVIELFDKTDGSHFDESDLEALQDGVKMISKVLEVRFLMAELISRVK